MTVSFEREIGDSKNLTYKIKTTRELFTITYSKINRTPLTVCLISKVFAQTTNNG